MAAAIQVGTHPTMDTKRGFQGPEASRSSTSLLKELHIIRLPTEPDDESLAKLESHSTFHIYSKKEAHKCISPVVDPSKERRSGPTPKETKAKRKDRKERKASGLPLVDPDDNAFFLHRPYLAFHLPPRVLYVGNSKHATPVVLIKDAWFWRNYKLQLGPSIAKPGVLDPRGVVSWKHNGGDKNELEHDVTKLKGYKVRTWRLWGETGKKYVHSVKADRKAQSGVDPDKLEKNTTASEPPATAEEAVILRWEHPFSRHTRRYHFNYAGIDFYWKGTGTVKETRTCGGWLRYNHLKLVAKVPISPSEKEEPPFEVCLGKYTSSVAAKKSGKLDLYDGAILKLIEEFAPSLLARDLLETQTKSEPEDEASKIVRMKRTSLYYVIVATGMCMINGEKEKREAVIEALTLAGEGGSGGGG